ncbi:aminotransferase class V-fold PLP-dependent enzyme [Nocardioidaceae bacterium SCSIO 66511]|nr:aminotransferase class V-fold PLP-dependent enzyme [Nocardioidaceae bacterium SCSIO 66511]
MNPLEPDRATRSEWADQVLATTDAFIAGLSDAPASNLPTADHWRDWLDEAPPEDGTALPDLLARIGVAASRAVETAGPGYLAYFPAGGLYSSVLGETLAQTLNRFTGVVGMAPELVAMEHGLLRWFGRQFGLPSDAGGVVTTGASVATLTALHTARESRLRWPDESATMYVTAQTHHCVAKAARITGFTADQIRTVPMDGELRMDIDAAEAMIARDRRAGRRPFWIVGTAGSTSTGTIDPLSAVGELARREGLWFHVDAAYGGGFILTERGREALSGIETADSIVFDPHKSMFLPYGTGVLLVRDRQELVAAHSADGDYLQDLLDDPEIPDFSDLGPELTRASRGLRMWLPLHLHGVDRFRSELDEKLDLARWAYEELSADPNLEVLLRPDLTVLVVRARAGEDATRLMFEEVNATGRIFVSSTQVDGVFTIRLCVLSHRTHRDRVEEAVAIVRDAGDRTKVAVALD